MEARFRGSFISPTLLIFFFLVALSRAELSSRQGELKGLFPSYNCPQCINREEHGRNSAARPDEKNIDILVTYTDANGAVRTRSINSKDLSISWVWRYPSDEDGDHKKSSKEVEGKSQKPDKLEGTIEHSKGSENQYGVVVEHKSASELHPIKLKRQRLRNERRERRTAELIQQDKEIENQIQDAAIERATELDTTRKGKYNIWRKEYENPNSDSTLKLMRDQIIMARAYATIAKAKNEDSLYDSLINHSRESQLAIGEATSDSELQPSALDRAKDMGHVLASAKDQLYDCMTLARKLRVMFQSAETGLNLLKKRSAFLIQLAAKTVPRPLHCLPLLLTTDFFIRRYEEREFPNKEKLEDPSLFHYAIFSDNVLAASVVVNSTILHAKEPEKHVFHIVTDKLNFPAMKMWFLVNPPAAATIHVENVDDFTWLNSSYCPVLRQLESARMIEYYFKAHQSNSLTSGTDNLKYRNPKYLSMLNHLRFYLPEVYPKLEKILFLDDDIVVQKDLTPLWSVNLQGMVNGAVETCKESFHRFDKYLNFSNPKISEKFDPNACEWAFGMNVFDLKEWRRRNITGIYHYWQEMNEERTLSKLGTLPPGLITFYNLTYPLDRSWHVLGLGYDPSLNKTEIQNGAVVHYNGNYKPWLDLAIAKYKAYWSRYVMFNNSYLQLCNINGQSVVSVLKACSKMKAIRMGESIHGFVISRGMGYDLFVHNSLIDLYSKCNDIDSSLRVFRGIPEKNVVSWNSLLSGLVQNEMHSEALTLFDSMQKAGVESDEVTLVNLLQLCKSFLDPYQCKLIHSRILRRGFELNELVTNSLIDAYASCNLITYAWSLFSNMRTRDAVTWSTMIAGFTHCGMPDEAIAVFREMSHTSEQPNAVTQRHMKRSRWAHGIAIRRGLASDVVVGTAILDMYSKCGSIGSSRKVFDRIPHKNVVTWSAIIAAYGMIGLPKEALALLAEMKICGLRPNQVTALSLLSACSHGGLVEEGLSLFEELIWDHEVEPGLEHYSCLVDLLARAGKVGSAMNLIGKLRVGLKPGASAWGALLSACRNYEHYEFGAISLPQVVELEPSSSAGYLLASNMYASGHSWVDATKMRMLAKDGGGVKAVAGYSLVYVNGKACRFLAGDNHHSLSDELQFAIQQLHSSMKMDITCG